MAEMGKRVIKAMTKNSYWLTIDGIATEADILPGMGVTRSTTGIAKNANEPTVLNQILYVANKDELKNRTVDDAWIINENMQAVQPESGDYVNVLVEDGSNITQPDTPIGPAGAASAGFFAIVTTAQAMGYSDEVIDVSGANALVRIRIK